MNKTDRQYFNLVNTILDYGVEKENRTGNNTISVFGHQMRFDMGDGFPLLTTKKVHTRSIIYELLWFIKGDTNIKYLNDNGVTIWDEWADENGDLGKIYSHQWRNWSNPDGTTTDQLLECYNTLLNNPDSRRIIVNSWNVSDLGDMRLPPCHCFYQFNTRPIPDSDRRILDLQLYQRSVDVPLGLPFNIASYALLLTMMARSVNMIPGEFVWTGGDCHIYKNQLDGIYKQLQNEPKELPTLVLNPEKDIWSYDYDDISINGYEPHDKISFPVSV